MPDCGKLFLKMKGSLYREFNEEVFLAEMNERVAEEAGLKFPVNRNYRNIVKFYILVCLFQFTINFLRVIHSRRENSGGWEIL